MKAFHILIPLQKTVLLKKGNTIRSINVRISVKSRYCTNQGLSLGGADQEAPRLWLTHEELKGCTTAPPVDGQ